MAAAGNDVARQVTQALARVRTPVFHADIVSKQTGGKLTINMVLTELQRRVKAGQLREVGAKNGARLFERIKTQAPQRAIKPVASLTAVAASSSSALAPTQAAAPDAASFMGFDDQDHATNTSAFDPETDFM